MKTYKVILMILVSSTIFLSSCKKDDTTSSTNTTTTTTITEAMTAKIDGKSWTASSVYEQDYGMMLIDGTASDGTSIALYLPSSPTTGTHTFNSYSYSYFIEYFYSGSNYVTADSGSITISTVNDTEIKGSFEAKTSVGDITSGTFTAKL